MSEFNLHNIQSDDLIFRFLSKRASQGDLNNMRLWLSKSLSNQRHFDEICDLWVASKQICRKNEFDPQMAWQKSKPTKSSNKQSNPVIQTKITGFFIRWQWVAAIFIVFFITGTIVTYLIGKNITPYNVSAYTEHYVPYGSKSVVTLPDGTRVWINSGSRLRYSQNFNALDRQVTLEGEAYFDVYKNAQKPFFVKTSGITVKVIGTAFNVKAYPDEKTIETTVERGMVQVFNNVSIEKTNERVFLHPKQKATYIKVRIALNEVKNTNTSVSGIAKQKREVVKANSLVINNDVVTKYVTSWKDTRWIIESEQLIDLAVKIERRYNVKIDFYDSKVRNYVFSGILEDESLEQVLEVIKMSAPIQYSLKQKKITFYENKEFIIK